MKTASDAPQVLSIAFHSIIPPAILSASIHTPRTLSHHTFHVLSFPIGTKRVTSSDPYLRREPQVLSRPASQGVRSKAFYQRGNMLKHVCFYTIHCEGLKGCETSAKLYKKGHRGDIFCFYGSPINKLTVSALPSLNIMSEGFATKNTRQRFSHLALPTLAGIDRTLSRFGRTEVTYGHPFGTQFAPMGYYGGLSANQ